MLIITSACFAKKGDSQAAIAELRTAIELAPEMAEAHHALGLSLQQEDELDAAIEAFRTAIKLRPNMLRAYNDLGLALMQKRDPDGAIAAFNRRSNWIQQYGGPA